MGKKSPDIKVWIKGVLPEDESKLKGGEHVTICFQHEARDTGEETKTHWTVLPYLGILFFPKDTTGPLDTVSFDLTIPSEGDSVIAEISGLLLENAERCFEVIVFVRGQIMRQVRYSF
jgi:hypothetical protein